MSQNIKKPIVPETKKPVPSAENNAKPSPKANEPVNSSHIVTHKAIEGSAANAKSALDSAHTSNEIKRPVFPVETSIKSVVKASEPINNVNAITSKIVGKSASNALSNLDSVHKSTQAVVTMGTEKIKEMFANTTREAQKSHSKAFEVRREGTEKVARALNAFERTVHDIVALSRQNMDVIVEVNNITADITRTSAAEMIKNANQNFAANLDICSEILGCRNVNDAMHISNKWLSTNIENSFAGFASLSEMFFQIISEASEPVNEHLQESAERFGKSFAA